MSTKRKIKFTCIAKKFFDIHGSTYHSVRITRLRDNKTITSGKRLIYGYGCHYEQTALKIMAENKFLPVKYRKKDNRHNYQRENNYPISFTAGYDLKRNAVKNGIM